MTLLVEHPGNRIPERTYALHVVLGELLGLDHAARPTDRHDVRITCPDDPHTELCVRDGLLAVDDADWLTTRSLPADATITTADGLPVLFGEPPAGASIVTDDARRIRFDADVFGVALFMLSRYEELVITKRDAHGRFAAASSVAARGGWLYRPIVNEYAELLWHGLSRAWPRLRRRHHAYKVHVSHDVDWPLVAAGWPWRYAMLSGAADIIKRGDATMAARRLRARALGSPDRPGLDPAWTFDSMMDAAEKRGLSAAFYFIADHPAGRIDGTYELDRPPIPGLLRTLHNRGHRVGLHGSYLSYRDPEQLDREFHRLRRVCAEQGVEQDTWGGRQHFLRWSNPTTWRVWEAAGLDYDATLGYADRLGFRCGVCQSFPVFDLEQRRPLKLRERPLVAMDVTALKYMGLTDDQTIERVGLLAATCRLYGGTMTLLWHNTLLMTGRLRKLYYRVLDACC